MTSRDREGRSVETYDAQGRCIDFLYTKKAGRLALRVLIRPWVSRSAGWLLNRRISAALIGPFVRKHKIALDDYEGGFRTYNEFFSRRIRPGLRPIDPEPSHLAAPCDGKLMVYPIGEDSVFAVKGVAYTMESLVRSAPLARRYEGGTLLLFRLTVDDYHRYCFAADGTALPAVHIPGVFHTVNPRAAENRPIYRENTREYALLETERFGTILMMEVGALLVGRIQNMGRTGPVRRGEEKGYFEFGGSTVILCFAKGKVTVDEDILRNSAQGCETVVKMGEKIGTNGGQ